ADLEEPIERQDDASHFLAWRFDDVKAEQAVAPLHQPLGPLLRNGRAERPGITFEVRVGEIGWKPGYRDHARQARRRPKSWVAAKLRSYEIAPPSAARNPPVRRRCGGPGRRRVRASCSRARRRGCGSEIPRRTRGHRANAGPHRLPANATRHEA